MSTTTIILAIAFYLLSCYFCYLTNKFAFKKSKAKIAPLMWFMPIGNTLSVIILMLLVLSEIGIFSHEYWAERWES